MPRRDVRLDVMEERRLHLDVAAPRVLSPAHILERIPDHHSLRMPERRAGRVVGQMHEVQLRPEPAMIPPPCLLHALDVSVEVGLRVEGRPVDPRQLRVLLVAAPIRTGEPGELDRLDRP